MDTSVFCDLRPCCFDCSHADIVVRTVRVGKTGRRQFITCSHEEVCRVSFANCAKPRIDELVLPYLEVE